MISERHERFGQLSQIGFDGAGDGFVLPFEPVFQAELVAFPPVQTHGEQLVDLGRDADHAVKTLVLQTAVFQLPEAGAHEMKAHLVQSRLLVFGRLAARLGVRRLLAVHGVQPQAAVFFRERLQRVHEQRPVFGDHVEAEALLDRFRHSPDARLDFHSFGRSLQDNNKERKGKQYRQ